MLSVVSLFFVYVVLLLIAIFMSMKMIGCFKLFVYRALRVSLGAFQRMCSLKIHHHTSIYREQRSFYNGIRDGLLIDAAFMGIKIGSVYVTYGSFYYGQKANYAVLYSLFVHPAFRRLGVATELVRLGYEKACENGFDEVFIMSDVSNFGIHILLRKNGFESFEDSIYKQFYAEEIGVYMNRKVIGFFKKPNHPA